MRLLVNITDDRKCLTGVADLPQRITEKNISEGLGADIIDIQREKRTDGEILHVIKPFFLKSKTFKCSQKYQQAEVSKPFPGLVLQLKLRPNGS